MNKPKSTKLVYHRQSFKRRPSKIRYLLNIFLCLGMLAQFFAPLVSVTHAQEPTPGQTDLDQLDDISQADWQPDTSTYAPIPAPIEFDWQIVVNPPVVVPGETATVSVTMGKEGRNLAQDYVVEAKIAGTNDNLQPLTNATQSLTGEPNQQLSWQVQPDKTDAVVEITVTDPKGEIVSVGYATVWLNSVDKVDVPATRHASGGPDVQPQGWVFRPPTPVPSLFSGSVNYSSPFEVPPARGGVGPSLALTYSSRTTDGKQGWHDSPRWGEGWSMSGLPSITRGSATYCGWQGSDQYFICFDGPLTLNLNGQHEIHDTGSCGSNCDLYQADNAPGLYIEFHHAGGNNHLGEYWLVRTPEGKEFRFGYQHDSEQVLARTCDAGWPNCDDAATYRWHLDQVTDGHGNMMDMQYSQDRAVNGFWGCTSICREVDVWPTLIRYNPRVTNPNRSTRNHWGSEVKFNYNSISGNVNDGQPIFHTKKQISNLEMFQYNVATNGWEETWQYTLDLNNYPCYDSLDQGGTYDGHCADGQSHLRILKSIQRQESGTNWNPVSFTYYGEGNNGVGTTADRNEAHVVGKHYWQGYTIEVRYPHMKTVDNGYDGIYEFTYADMGWRHNVRNWRLNEMKMWDGVEFVYGGWNSTPQQKHVFLYEDPCFNQYGDCYSGSGDESFTLVGHKKGNVVVYDGAGQFLSRQNNAFYVASNGGGHPSLYGKLTATTSYADAAGTLKLRTQLSTWFVNNGTHCPRTGIASGVDWACKSDVTNLQYEPIAGNPVIGNSKVEFRYDTSYQDGRQWGMRTHVRPHTYNAGTSSYELIRHDLTFFQSNTAGNVWRIVPYARFSYTHDWRPFAGGLFLYDNNTDPNNQTLVRTSQLKWTRKIVDLPSTAGSTGSTSTLTTVDTQVGYTVFGLPHTTTTYSDYGQQRMVWGQDWLPVTNFASDDAATIRTNYLADDNLVTQVQSVQDPQNGTTSINYGGTYPWSVASVVAPNGLSTDYAYNNLGQLMDVIGPEVTTTGDSTMHYDYNLTTPVEITTIAHEGTGLNTQRRSTNTYDGLGRLLDSVVHDVNGNSSTRLITTMDHDGLGRVVCQSLPTYWGVGWTKPTCAGSSGSGITTRQYDNAGRVTQVIAPNGLETTVTYATPNAGNWVSHSSLGGAMQSKTVVTEDGVHYRTNIQTMDDQGRLAWVAQYSEESFYCTGGIYETTRYEYDIAGNVTLIQRGRLCDRPQGSLALTMLETNVTLTHDSLGRKLSMTDPDLGLWEYEYDASSRIIEQRGAVGTSDQVITCADYDKMGRLQAQWESLGSSCGSVPSELASNFLTAYDYFDTPNLANYGQVKQIRWYPHASGMTGLYRDTFQYDSLGRLEKQTRLINGKSYVNEVLTFDRASRPVEVKHPNGQVLDTTYNYFGADSLTLGTQPIVHSTNYNNRGQMTNMMRGNGVGTYYAYGNVDNGFRTSNVWVVANSSLHAHYQYSYDALGQMTQSSSTFGNDPTETETFTYDYLGRLKTANETSGDYTMTYNYDNYGNLRSVYPGSSTNLISYYQDSDIDSSVPLHAVGSMRIQSGEYQYAYDGRGNMTTRQTEDGLFEHEFDVLGRLTEVTKDGSETTRFIYDANGSRVLTEESDGTRIYTPFPEYEEEHEPTPPPDTPVSISITNPNWWESNIVPRICFVMEGNGLPTEETCQSFTSSLATTVSYAEAMQYDVFRVEVTLDSTHSVVNHTATPNTGAFIAWNGSFANYVWSNWDTNAGNHSFSLKINGSGGGGCEKLCYDVSDANGQHIEADRADKETPNNFAPPTIIKRSTYMLGGSSVATEVVNHPEADKNGIFFTHGNHLGSMTLMTDMSGDVVDEPTRFLPFGEYRAGQMTSDDLREITDKGFTGHRENRDLGLTYMNARYYAPELRRFISADTMIPNVTDTMGWNRYAYVNNNPINFIDPSGHCATTTQTRYDPGLNEQVEYEGRDPNDSACWEQYDELHQMLTDEGIDADTLLGPGEAWTYVDDWETFLDYPEQENFSLTLIEYLLYRRYIFDTYGYWEDSVGGIHEVLFTGSTTESLLPLSIICAGVSLATTGGLASPACGYIAAGETAAAIIDCATQPDSRECVIALGVSEIIGKVVPWAGDDVAEFMDQLLGISDKITEAITEDITDAAGIDDGPPVDIDDYQDEDVEDDGPEPGEPCACGGGGGSHVSM